jgi:hypothetical protein
VQPGEYAEHFSRALTGSATRKRERSYRSDSTPAKFGRPISPRHKGEVSRSRGSGEKRSMPGLSCLS